MMRIGVLVCGVVLASAVACQAQHPQMAPGVPQLFVDSRMLNQMTGCELRLHSPQPREVSLVFDKPWEGRECAYVTVLEDGGKFRMYYRAGGETTVEYAALAESSDGIVWQRPSLGLIEFNGGKDNNLMYKGRGKSYWETHNFTPFVDTNPKASAAQRYKALGLGRHVLESGEDVKALAALVSPDGINWKLLQDKPIITTGSFDSQNVAFWDGRLGLYVCYVRDGRPTPGGGRVRSVARCTSPDFVKWTDPEWLDFGDSPLEQFYTNAIVQYPYNPDMYLGFPMRFVPERKSIGEKARTIDGVSDAVFISSRDGLKFDRQFMEAFIRPGLDQANWGNAHGNNTPAWGLLLTGPNELSVYWAEHYGTTPRVRRGTVRLHGFGSIHAGYRGGEAVTKSLVFGGKRLKINYSTSAIGSVKVEMLDGSGNPIPGFTLDECKEIFGDETSRVVTWKQGADVSSLVGRVIRMRFALKDADLYSFEFGEADR